MTQSSADTLVQASVSLWIRYWDVLLSGHSTITLGPLQNSAAEAEQKPTAAAQVRFDFKVLLLPRKTRNDLSRPDPSGFLERVFFSYL